MIELVADLAYTILTCKRFVLTALAAKENKMKTKSILIAAAVFIILILISNTIYAQSWEQVITDKGIKIIDHFPLPESNLSDDTPLRSTAAAPETPIVPLSETFKLHSQPGATKVIYLDFDGHDGFDGTYSPFNFEGSEDTFSDAELIRIQLAWKSVAEDFIPFDVDVTTEFPGIEALKKSGGGDTQWGCRVVITHGPWDYSWAYIGSFNSGQDQEVYAYAGNNTWIWIGDSISHEVGHALYLGHDGTTTGVEYYAGHGSGLTHWAPIMGWTKMSKPYGLSQWSIGEYSFANNNEDDLQIIATRNGFGYRQDDHGSTTASATFLNLGSQFADDGIIERTDDIDYFTFTMAENGKVVIDINPDPLSPNLDILAKIHDANGSVIYSSNPPDSLNARFNVGLSAGKYFLSIDGTGYDDPNSDGYSDYASLGYFSIDGQVTYTDGQQYILTVNSGSGGGIYYEGQVVSINADPAPAGQHFEKWIASDGVVFADINSSSTTMTMPAKDAIVTATYEDITNSGKVVNLVMPSNGGVLESFTSEYGSGWVASDLTNGITGEDGWSSTADPGPQEFVFSFLDGLSATLNEAVIHSGTGEGTYFSKDVEVWTSADGSNYSMAASGVLQNSSNTSVTLDLEETTARKVKLVITSGYRADYWELGEFEVYGFFGVTPVEDSEFIPSEFGLAQNYPNPFNPVTHIQYSVPAVGSGHAPSIHSVTLKVYDMLGKEIAVLVDEEQYPGEYEVMFNASNLSTGIYLLQLRVGNFMDYRKMMLIK
jgi:hypothetical protein